MPPHEVVLAQTLVVADLVGDVGGQVAPHEGADFLAEILFGSGESQVHVRLPAGCWSDQGDEHIGGGPRLPSPTWVGARSR
ncbi:hypothetical protein D3C87_1357530 [compost metagenome]